MPPKILIVDDEDDNRELISDSLLALHRKGVTILTAADGEEALETIIEERPNLVFLDVMMPRMDGFEVCQVVKHRLRLHDVFIVILTAKDQDFNQERGEIIGADIYMTKPFKPEELYQIAVNVLGL